MTFYFQMENLSCKFKIIFWYIVVNLSARKYCGTSSQPPPWGQRKMFVAERWPLWGERSGIWPWGSTFLCSVKIYQWNRTKTETQMTGGMDQVVWPFLIKNGILCTLTIRQSINQSIKSINQSVSQSVSYSVGQSVSQLERQSVSQLVSERGAHV